MGPCKLFGTVVCAALILSSASAATPGRDDATTASRPACEGQDPLPPFFPPASDPPQLADGDDTEPCCAPRWTASADFILWDRAGNVNQTLVQVVPPGTSLKHMPSPPIDEALNADDLCQGFHGGPRLDLVRRGDNGYDLELSYFQIDGWSGGGSVGPYDPKTQLLVMQAPGGFVQTQDKDQAMAWEDATKLYNAEFNVRWHPCDRAALLAGFRWVQLRDDLVGSLEPSEGFPPFWNADANNNLYGFQIGALGDLWNRGRFSIDGLVKAGIYDDDADAATGVSIYKRVRPASCSTNHAAFVGETGLFCKCQIAGGLGLRVGYEAMWLEGVALAPAQIKETAAPKSAIVQALGVDCNSGAFFHGASIGLEYSF